MDYFWPAENTIVLPVKLNYNLINTWMFQLSLILWQTNIQNAQVMYINSSELY